MRIRPLAGHSTYSSQYGEALGSRSFNPGSGFTQSYEDPNQSENAGHRSFSSSGNFKSLPSTSGGVLTKAMEYMFGW